MLSTFASVLWLTAVGCSDGRPERVPISGQVLIDGKPLNYGHISVLPENDRASTGQLDENGKFSLSCYQMNDGVVVGTHGIEIIAREPIGEDRFKWHAPKKYADVDTSGLSETFSAPNDSLVINLTWDGKKGPFVEIIE
jgi:hypothetical protein